MPPENQQRREDCRREVRRYLAERPMLSMRAQAIEHMLERDFGFTLDEVRAALVFLVSAKQVEVEPDQLGATDYFKITAAGTLAHERRQ